MATEAVFPARAMAMLEVVFMKAMVSVETSERVLIVLSTWVANLLSHESEGNPPITAGIRTMGEMTKSHNKGTTWKYKIHTSGGKREIKENQTKK